MESEYSNWRASSVNAKSEGISVGIEKHCWQKMFGWCRAAKTEVSGLGLVELVNGKFRVYDVFFPKQYCSTGYTELDDEAVGSLNYLVNKSKRKVEDLKFWWHTHYNFGTFWSGTDDDTAQRLAKSNGQWELSLVINQAGRFLCRADFISPINITVDELKVETLPNSKHRERKRNFKADIKKWVHPHVSSNSGYGEYGYKDVISQFPKNLARWYESFYKGKKNKGVRLEHMEYSFNKKTEPFGSKYILHKGKFMTREMYERVTGKQCWCIDGMCWECREKKEKKVKFKEEQKTFIFEPAKKEICYCGHTGEWEACICGKDCYKCLEMQEAYIA